MADVFLSYSREDRARAEQVAQGLTAEGLNVFWDNEIPPGQTWADYIETKLTQCRALIVLWSEHSTKSQWVREEARLGRDKGVLIPVMVDASAPPFGFGEVQAANLADWNGDASDPRWQRLVGAVKAFESSEPRPRPMEPPRAPTPPAAQARTAPPTEQTAPPKKSIPAWAWIVGAVVVAIVVLGVIGNMTNQQQVATTPQQVVGEATAPVQQPTQPQQPAANAEQYTQQVLARLSQAQQSFTSQGFQQITQPYSGQLAQGQYQNIPLTLNAGGEYRVVGVCDNDCGDFDLALYDANNNVVSQDNLTDAIPVVSVQPQVNGQFTVQAVMHTCNVSPCYYALALYGRSAAADAQ